MGETRTLALCLLFVALAVLGSCEKPFFGTPRDCPANEVYKPCGPACQTECATLNQPCYIAYVRCPDGCYCVDGFARDANSTCIPINKC